MGSRLPTGRESKSRTHESKSRGPVGARAITVPPGRTPTDRTAPTRRPHPLGEPYDVTPGRGAWAAGGDLLGTERKKEKEKLTAGGDR